LFIVLFTNDLVLYWC